MASYTEYFYEYIENGNEMPSVFDGVPSLNGKTFKEIFRTHFNAYEIGLETETLFKERLQAKADVVIPYYVDKISKLAGVENVFVGERNSKISRDNQNASYLNTPNIETISNDNLAGVLKDNTTENYNETFTPKGTNKIEMIKNYLDIENLYNKLLNEFNSLFLFIW